MAASPDKSDCCKGGCVGRRVIVAVTGGIACYKTPELVSQLVQSGVEVRVLMTESAMRFVTPITFSSLSNGPVISSIWDAQENHSAPHIAAARWCDLMVIAPASANIIAKLAAGICDDVVSLVAATVGDKKPLLLAPAMNEDMWTNPVTIRNVATVTEMLGGQMIGPETGWQACRTTGPGRMSEANSIRAVVTQRLMAFTNEAASESAPSPPGPVDDH